MNFYNVVIQLQGAGESSQAVHKFSSFDEAVASFHTEMAYAINAGLKGVTCLILDEEGGLHMKDTWRKMEEIKTETAAE